MIDNELSMFGRELRHKPFVRLVCVLCERGLSALVWTALMFSNQMFKTQKAKKAKQLKAKGLPC